MLPLWRPCCRCPIPLAIHPWPRSPERQKQQTQDALIAWLAAEAEQQPAWRYGKTCTGLYPSTLEWLGLWLDQAPTVRLLTLLTCRPEFAPLWGARAALTQLTLTRLTRPQVEEMVRRMTGGKTLPAEVMRQIVARTDGVPLFVEELTKTVLEAGWLQEGEDGYELTGPLPPLAIPVTLQDALRARLDRLTEGKAVAQLGAVLGRTFSYELLRAVASADEATLQHGLVQLVEAEALYQRGRPPLATYVFKHALIQEVAYQSLLKSTRQQHHQRIAQVLAEQFPDLAETQPELLAYHYTEAGLNASAVDFWQRAGERAGQRSAHAEVISHCTKGLEVLMTLPHSPARTQQELVLQTLCSPALAATKGLAAPETGHAYARARELCQQVGKTARLFPVLWGLWMFYSVRAQHETALELGQQFFALSQHQQASDLLAPAYRMLGTTSFFLGELRLAHSYLEQGRALYDPHQHQSLVFLYRI